MKRSARLLSIYVSSQHPKLAAVATATTSKVEKTAWRRGRESLDALHNHAEDAGDEGELRQSRSLCRLFQFQNRALWRWRQPHAVADGSTNSLIFDVSCPLALPQVRSNGPTEKIIF